VIPDDFASSNRLLDERAAGRRKAQTARFRATVLSPARLLPSILGGHPRLTVAYAAACLLLIALVAWFVDLEPRVEQDFFFSSHDPAVSTNEAISELFPGGSQVILSVGGDLGSSGYYARLAALTRDLERVSGVTRVQSATEGPRSPRHAARSPLWRRLVLGRDGASTLVLVWLAEPAPRRTVPSIEQVVARHRDPSFEIRVSGAPFVIEVIRRSLVRDMIVFSTAAVLVFGLIVVLLFRSLPVLLGTLVSCISASCATLLTTRLFDLRIGVLTANLVTIVFVMTLHPIIYMTFAWKEAAATGATGRADTVSQAVREMLAASAWVMLTTFLGFGSLLFVQAQPLRELGISGAIGAVLAFGVAYLVHPSFLRLARPRRPNLASGQVPRGVPALLARRHVGLVAALLVLAALSATGMSRLNKDPSLFAYFARGGEIREGLESIDRNGGSSPLRIVVHDAAGTVLYDKRTYRRLWRLQTELERHPAVGTVLSLPLIVSEAKRSPLGFLYSRKSLLDRMERPAYGGVTRSFVAQDRKRALFTLRMKEAPERHDRLAVVEQIESIVEAHGFAAERIGGPYFLQGRLSSLVASSLVTGVSQLLLGFLVVAAIVSRSPRWSLGLVATLCLVPAIVLGLLGYLHVPLDVVSAPAVNIALGMAIDDMLHMTHLARTLRRRGASDWQAWIGARAAQWKPLLGTMATVSAGFAIFALSSFPPTQRFGLVVVAGSLLDVLACLLVLPLLAGARSGGERGAKPGPCPRRANLSIAGTILPTATHASRGLAAETGGGTTLALR